MDGFGWWVAGLVLVGIVAAAVVWARRARPPVAVEGLPPPPRTAPRHPLVLLHGAFGFDEIVLAEGRHAYFRGVTERLEARGVLVHRPTVAPVAGIARRAAELAERIRALPPGRVNLVAHSMGGLDARFAITHLGLKDRVASLVTIGCPHHGTPLADVGHAVARSVGLAGLLKGPAQMLADLSTDKMARFNASVVDVPGVFYASVAGRIPPGTPLALVQPLLAAGFTYLSAQAGDNDGLVPVASQEWGELLRIVDADHWAQIGWSGQVDTPAIYEQIADALLARGL